MNAKLIDIIIILGKGVNLDGSLPQRVQQEINYALIRCREQQIHAILFSGRYSGLHKPTPITEAVAMKLYAARQPAAAGLTLLTEEQSEDTIGNIVFSKLIIDQHNWKNILVMSTADHLQRVQYICKKVFGPNYQLQYHGFQQVITARQYWHIRRYEFMSWWFARRFLRHTWPDDNLKMLTWLHRYHFLYNGSRLKQLLQNQFKRPLHR